MVCASRWVRAAQRGTGDCSLSCRYERMGRARIVYRRSYAQGASNRLVAEARTVQQRGVIAVSAVASPQSRELTDHNSHRCSNQSPGNAEHAMPGNPQASPLPAHTHHAKRQHASLPATHSTPTPTHANLISRHLTPPLDPPPYMRRRNPRQRVSCETTPHYTS